MAMISWEVFLLQCLFIQQQATLTLLCLYLLQLVTGVNCRNDHLKRIFKNHIIKIFDLKIDLARPLIKIQLLGEVFSTRVLSITRNTIVYMNIVCEEACRDS